MERPTKSWILVLHLLARERCWLLFHRILGNEQETLPPPRLQATGQRHMHSLAGRAQHLQRRDKVELEAEPNAHKPTMENFHAENQGARLCVNRAAMQRQRNRLRDFLDFSRQ